MLLTKTKKRKKMSDGIQVHFPTHNSLDSSTDIALGEIIPGISDESARLVPDKVQTVSRGIFGDLIKGLAKSRILRSLIFSAISVGVLFAITSTPAGWLIALVLLSSLLISLLAQFQGNGWQKFTFETSTIYRLFIKKNYNKIFTLEENGAQIFLGALPNRLSSDGEKLVNDEEVSAVLSLNEDWEKIPTGLSVSYTAEDWADLGIDGDNFKQIRVLDHHPLDENQFNEVADWIRDRLAERKNVYVHCRGGNGRSAMAIAAYLVKYQNHSKMATVEKAVEWAETQIKENRPSSTIKKKREALIQHASKSCSNLFSH